MAQNKYKKLAASLLTIGGFIISANHAAAVIVTLDFDALDPLSTYHGQTITENGYTLNSSLIRSVKPGAFNSNGTTSIYTQSSEITITHGPSNDLAFDALSIDFGDLLASATPDVSFSGVKADNSVVTDHFVISGQSYWTYPFNFSSLFTNLVSLTLGFRSPALYQIDNIQLSSAFTITDQISPNPLPETLPMFAVGALSFFLLGRRKRKTKA